jgi:hypothetical protein
VTTASLPANVEDADGEAIGMRAVKADICSGFAAGFGRWQK